VSSTVQARRFQIVHSERDAAGEERQAPAHLTEETAQQRAGGEAQAEGCLEEPDHPLAVRPGLSTARSTAPRT
jgi:hypothetical protein